MSQRVISVLGRTVNIQFLCINEATYLAGFDSRHNRTVVDNGEVAIHVFLPGCDRVLGLRVFTARMGPPLGEQTMDFRKELFCRSGCECDGWPLDARGRLIGLVDVHWDRLG